MQSQAQLPIDGSVWKHKSGRLYKVLFIANNVDKPKPNYPVTVVYQDIDSLKIWAGRFKEIENKIFVLSLNLKKEDVEKVYSTKIVVKRGYHISFEYARIKDDIAYTLIKREGCLGGIQYYNSYITNKNYLYIFEEEVDKKTGFLQTKEQQTLV